MNRDDRPGSLFEYFDRRNQRPPNPLGLWIAAGIAAGTVIAAATGVVWFWVLAGAGAGFALGMWRARHGPHDPVDR